MLVASGHKFIKIRPQREMGADMVKFTELLSQVLTEAEKAIHVALPQQVDVGEAVRASVTPFFGLHDYLSGRLGSLGSVVPTKCQFSVTT
jgi:hypothetical protein